MSKEYILFDLDGTLTDPKPGITGCVKYSLESFGIKVDSLDDLVCFIGPPLKESFMVYYGMDDETAEKAVAKYRERFAPIGIFENLVFDGIEPMLKKLKAAGKTLALATSKPEIYAKQILEHYGIAPYFTFSAGSELDGRRTVKAEVISYCLENLGVQDLSKAVMVGDRKHDIIGAKANGLESVGVLFGYGSREELENAGADHIANDVAQLKELLLNM